MSFYYLLILTIVSTLIQDYSNYEMNREGKDFALFFAVQEYDEWQDLRNPIKDTKAVAKDLRDLYGFSTEVIVNPTKQEVYKKLQIYRKKQFSKDGQLLVFFSGHGEFNEGIKEGYFIPKDGKENDPFQDSYLSHRRLELEISSIPCNHILLAIDACYSGTFSNEIALSRGRPNTRPGVKTKNQQQIFIENTLRYKTRLFLTSGGKERTPDGLDHSPFTTQILAGLRSFGGDDGILTFYELVSYVEKANPRPRWGQFSDNEIGSSFLFVNNKRKPKVKAPAIENGEEFVLYTDGTLYDKRDGQSYKTITIDGKVWFTENLNYKIDGSSCYNDDAQNCKKYGRNYDWEAAMKACPKGFHLSTREEWMALINKYGGYVEYLELEEIGDANKTFNEFADVFNIRFGGYYELGDNYLGKDSIVFFWTSTKEETFNESIIIYGFVKQWAGIVEEFHYSCLMAEGIDGGMDKFSCLCVKDRN